MQFIKTTSLSVVFSIIAFWANAATSANLDQARNGTDASPISPATWANGNAGSSQAHYNEGMSAPYRCVMTGLPIGTQITVVIGYDVRNSSKNAFDYLTHYNRLLPHSFSLHSTAETIAPLSGSGLAANTAYTTYAIPQPSSIETGIAAGQPRISYNSLPAAERVMTLFNGTIDTIYYVTEGDLTASTSETQMAIVFTVSGTTAVLAWGGHIASRTDWGIVSGVPQSAGGISGSPFHMRLISFSAGSSGNQDRSLSGSAVSFTSTSLPVELLSFTAKALSAYIQLNWITASEINSDYFTVQKSTDGIHFRDLARIKAAGNSSRAINYDFADDEPATTTLYYRLLQTDYDGTLNDYGTLCVKSKEERYTRLLIYNLQGMLLKAIENPSGEINVSELPAGCYLLQYVGRNKNYPARKVVLDGLSLKNTGID